MSDYKYTDEGLNTLLIRQAPVVLAGIFVDTNEEADGLVFVPNDDVPRVALELLKAAGYGDQNNPLAATDAIADLNGIITELEVIANTKQPA